MFMHDLSRSNPLRPIESLHSDFARSRQRPMPCRASLVLAPQLRRLIAAGILIALCLSAYVVTAAERQIFKGHVPKDLPALTAIGRLDKSQRLNLALGLPLRNKSTLIKLIAALCDPANPQFRQYLTPDQFAAMFGPTEVDYAGLIDFAKANGLNVTFRHPNRLLLDVNASVENIEKAFHVQMKLYQHPTESRTFYAPDLEPSVDAKLPLIFIGGFNNFDVPHPMNLKASLNAHPNNGSSPNGSFMGNDFRNAYAPGVTLSGAGQTVALVQFDGFYQNDITAYEALAGLPNVPLQTILLDGYDGVPSTTAGNVEVSLDIEMLISMAPGLSKIILYEGGPGGIPADILSQIANDNVAKQISSSWTWQPYDPNSEAIFLQFAAQGQTCFNATGDGDAFVGAITQTPSDNPYITQVGGTSLTMSDSGEGYITETVWNRGGGIGSSGGTSTAYGIPAWQQIIDMSANSGSTKMRNVPDVSMVADYVYVIHGNGSSGSFGGTSCAAPLWAGFTALMNQQAIAAGRPPIGFINPAIYQLATNSNYANCFHDITIGDNTSSASPAHFYATTGYDLCTGLGSPVGSNLVNAIAGPPVFAPLILPKNFALVMETCPNSFIDPGETVSVSFELKNTGLVSTTNLVATLQSSSGIFLPSEPQSYGALVGGGEAVERVFTFVANGSCGESNTAVLHLQDGAADLGAVTFSFALGHRSTSPIIAENFDAVSAPNLPAGWTVSWTGGGAPWSTTSAIADTPPNSVFARDPASSSDNKLISPPLIVGGSSQLSFRHNYYTETVYDGGALEISIGGGPFKDILTAGGSFLTNGYTQTISTCCGNPLGGRLAWTGSSGGFISTVVNLPPAASGQTVQFSWRFCSDSVFGATGWYIDDVSVVDGFTCCRAIQPLIRSIVPSSNGIAIVWNSVSNRSYRLQSNTNIAETNWIDIPGDVQASSFSASKTDFTEQQSQNFYRVVLLP
jgi:hypothetical protein